MKTRRDILKSTIALAGIGTGIAGADEEESQWSALDNMPPEAVGARIAMSVKGFEELVEALMASNPTCWGIHRNTVHTSPNGTSWFLLDTLRQGHLSYRTRDDAVSACTDTSWCGQSVPLFTVTADGRTPTINPEWRRAKWMVATVLRAHHPRPSLDDIFDDRPASDYEGKIVWRNTLA